MYYGVASLSHEDGTIYVNVLEHNITTKEEASEIVKAAHRIVAQGGIKRVIVAYPQMLNHTSTPDNCGACMSAVEETLSREEARRGGKGLEEPPATPDPPSTQRLGELLGEDE